jgi:hypothetical protein
MTVELKLARLATLSPTELRAEWGRLMKEPVPPALTADLIRRALAYRVQEQAAGGLPRAVRLELERLGHATERTQPIVLPTARIKPGTRLVRDWGGLSHHVVVEEGGFRYKERRYRSLSEVARAITGARWSGPRFFGLAGARG